MGLWERLQGNPEVIDVDVFMASVRENGLDHVTLEEIQAAFDLTAADMTNVEFIINTIFGIPATSSYEDANAVLHVWNISLEFANSTEVKNRLDPMNLWH